MGRGAGSKKHAQWRGPCSMTLGDDLWVADWVTPKGDDHYVALERKVNHYAPALGKSLQTWHLNGEALESVILECLGGLGSRG